MASFSRFFRFSQNGIARHQTVSVASVKKGYSATVFTQLSDIEEETNGLITYDRKKIKMNPLIVQKWNMKLKKSLRN